jgi:hypothetical protein
LFAVFITRQFIGNIKESLVPYIQSSLKQLKIIDKTKNSNLETEKNQDIIKNLDRLKSYAKNYNAFNKFINESDEEEIKKTDKNETDSGDSQEISQPEVESLMPKVD